MSEHLERYIFMIKELQQHDLDDQLRNNYEDEIDELYYDLDEEDLEYIVRYEIEV